MKISHNDPRLSWHGHISLEQTPEYSRPWRIPFGKRALFNTILAERAAMPAGVRLAFHSDTRTLAGVLMPQESAKPHDLYIDGQLFGTSECQGAFAFDSLPSGEKLLELWLPQRGEFALRELEIDDGASLAPHEDTRPRWIVYGSSITHCGEAASPSQTWPAIVARGRDLNLTCLGFGGQCHLDPQIALMMRDLPADYLTMKIGINIQGHSSLNARTFGANLIGFVQILREKHPTTPLLLASPIYSFDRETTPNVVGWSLQDYRRAVEEAARTLQESGDENLFYLSGLELFDESLGHLMPDKLHPDTQGYRALGENFLQKATPLLFEGR
jgi:lysophospholipase L1-like esterase